MWMLGIRGDRVVEARDDALVEVDSGDVRDRVHEVVERPRRRRREEEEDRLRAERRQRGGAAEAVILGRGGEEAHQPPDVSPTLSVT
jgi:hypothetical protein